MKTSITYADDVLSGVAIFYVVPYLPHLQGNRRKYIQFVSVNSVLRQKESEPINLYKVFTSALLSNVYEELRSSELSLDWNSAAGYCQFSKKTGRRECQRDLWGTGEMTSFL